MALTAEQQQEYQYFLSKITQRTEEVSKFEEFLRSETAWLTSPASTKFHLCEESGLIVHSLNVTRTLLKIREVLAPDITEESCVIVALYHDTGKVGMPGKPYYLPNPDEWQVSKRKIKYITNPNLVYMDIATRSLFLVSKFIPLTATEAQAIRYHDGQYIDDNRSVAHKETNLTRLIQFADNWSSGALEE